MINSDKKLKIPAKEKHFILPDVRQKIFTEIYTMYQRKYTVKLLYAYMNTDPELIIDYLVVYKSKNTTGDKDLIVFDCVPAHSDRSTPGYRYCKRTGITNDFYEEGINSMVVMEKNKFYEFITHGLGLSTDKNDKLYWRSPDNYKELLNGLLDLSVRYVKRKPTE